jgi:hypothetical protein
MATRDLFILRHMNYVIVTISSVIVILRTPSHTPIVFMVMAVMMMVDDDRHSGGHHVMPVMVYGRHGDNDGHDAVLQVSPPGLHQWGPGAEAVPGSDQLWLLLP